MTAKVWCEHVMVQGERRKDLDERLPSLRDAVQKKQRRSVVRTFRVIDLDSSAVKPLFVQHLSGVELGEHGVGTAKMRDHDASSDHESDVQGFFLLGAG